MSKEPRYSIKLYNDLGTPIQTWTGVEDVQPLADGSIRFYDKGKQRTLQPSERVTLLIEEL